MTRAEIEALSGIDLDQAVAERIMGWAWEETEDGPMLIGPESEKIDGWLLRGFNPKFSRLGMRTTLTAYSTDWAAMGLVVAAMDKIDCDLEIEKAGAVWYVTFMCNVVSGSILPEAVARAALLAVSEGEF